MNLYHASGQKNLSELTPQPTKSNDEYIGDYVFATKNYKMALMYLVPKGLPTLMSPENEPNIVICSTPQAFKEKDKGGAIYTVPADNFQPTPQGALSNYEMVSQKPVKPTSKDTYQSVFTALHRADIKIRFVSYATFNKLLRHPRQKQLITELPTHKPV
ncbi:MAG: hypothetical protein U5L95_04030 [Candidatus Saccharibacteria bacterium]|nr:hypothetical protein [Candidatus Saccharibacteria bacterium]